MNKFNLTFSKDEAHLSQHLRAQPKPGAYLKRLIEKDMAQDPNLYARIFGDIEPDYGTMKKFIQDCGIDAVRSRLKGCSEIQREHLTRVLKAKHKELKDL